MAVSKERRAAAIDAAKALKAFKESVEGKQYMEVAVALFEDALTTGLAQQHARLQGEWARLNPEYKAWKERNGLSGRIWEMTGASLAAVTNNAVKELGKKVKGLKTGINWRKDLAWVAPMAFKRKVRIKGKRAGTRTRQLGGGSFKRGKLVGEIGGSLTWKPATNEVFQMGVLRRMKYGSKRHKVLRWASQGQGRRADDWSDATGSRSANQPGRRWIVWTPELIRAAAERVARAVERVVGTE